LILHDTIPLICGRGEEFLERAPEYLSDPDMLAASLVEQEYLQALGKEEKTNRNHFNALKFKSMN
jgi:hypothetical protein